jgi:cellulose synthase/poly-beta-1,6-N-acetylglucosamine synthase-like glycosyltransferase
MSSSWILIASSSVGGYVLLMVLYSYFFLRLRPFRPSPAAEAPVTFFTIIIPARNESACIANCVQSVLGNQYPQHLFEVIVVDDHSEDDTAEQVKQLQHQHTALRLIQLQHYTAGTKGTTYKKQAIEAGIQASKGNWIVTTDADAVVPVNWLHLLAAYIGQYEPVFIAAPVTYYPGRSLLSVFQQLDFMTLQGITAASVGAGFHSMCNGANLAYKKEVFHAVGGFSGNEHLATGDDMLLMHKVKRAYPAQIGYLYSRDAAVITWPPSSWKAFLHQRIRWASKADSYDEPVIFGVLCWVWLMNALLLLALPLMLFMGEISYPWLKLMAIKTGAELLFLLPVALFFQRSYLLVFFPLLQPFHILYMVMAGWLGKFGSYEWKNRIIVTQGKK